MKTYGLRSISKIILKCLHTLQQFSYSISLTETRGVLDLLLSIKAGLMKFNKGSVSFNTFLIQQTIQATALHTMASSEALIQINV